MNKEEEQLIEYINKYNLSTLDRPPGVAEKRFYIMGILYYKHGWNEFQIGDLFNKHHSSVNYGKKKPYAFFEINDEQFIQNCVDLIQDFPYSFPEPEKYVKKNNKRVFHKLTKPRQKKLLKFKNDNGLHNLNQAINHLIDTFL